MKSLKLDRLSGLFEDRSLDFSAWCTYLLSGIIFTAILLWVSHLYFAVDNTTLARTLMLTLLAGTCLGTAHALLHGRIQSRIRKTLYNKQSGRMQDMATHIKRLAYYDASTQLPNQFHFQRLLDKSISTATDKRSSFSLLLIDIGGFVDTNENYGHAVGNVVLTTIASRLRKIARPRNYLVTKPGASEFAVIIPKQLNDQHLYAFSQALLARVNEEILHENLSLQPKIRIGVARFPDHGSTRIEICSNAALALKHAKENDSEKASLFLEGMRTKAIRLRNVERKLKMNLEKISSTDFNLHYQPKINLHTGELAGVEALLRWHDDELGYVNPLETFSVAEKTSDVLRLTELLFEQILADINYWAEENSTLLSVAFNLHPEILKKEDSLLSLIDRFERSKLPRESVIFEITEDCIVGDDGTRSTQLLQTLVEKGFLLSLDDFGTGFASLTHLKGLPSQEIKIDRSFVFDIAENPESESIVKALLAIAKETGKNVVAEGIETTEQLQLLKYHGCEVGQGFLFSKAVPTESILGFIKQTQPFYEHIDPAPA